MGLTHWARKRVKGNLVTEDPTRLLSKMGPAVTLTQTWLHGCVWSEQSQQPALSLGSTVIILKFLIICEHQSLQTMQPTLLLFTETEGVLINCLLSSILRGLLTCSDP